MTALLVRRAYAPQAWIYLVAGVAAVAAITEHLRSSGMGDRMAVCAGHSGLSQMAGMEKMGPMTDTHPAVTAMGVGSIWVWWVVMVMAMMLPVAAPSAARLAFDSLWRRRHLAMLEYLIGYLAIWAVFGVGAIWAVFKIWPAGAPWVVVVAVLLAAALWQVTRLRKRLLRRCGGRTFVNVYGWRADRDCVLAGCTYGRRCALICAPVMGVMALEHSAILMVAITGLLLSERAPGPNPADRPGRPLEAICLAGLAVLVGGLAVLHLGSLP
jgi:predicted metal-binding membrane protein